MWLTWRAVVEVEVSQDYVEGHQVFQHLLSLRWLGWGLAKLGPPLQQQVQLLTAYGGITWWARCAESRGRRKRRTKEEDKVGGEKQLLHRTYDKNLRQNQPGASEWKWPELIYTKGVLERRSRRWTGGLGTDAHTHTQKRTHTHRVN